MLTEVPAMAAIKMDGFLADVETITHAFERDWVNLVWTDEFIKYEPLRHEAIEKLEENFYNVDILGTMCKQLGSWAGCYSSEDGNALWRCLTEQKLEKAIVAALFYYIDTGRQTSSSKHQQEAGILASTIYLYLLRVPLGLLKVFHSVIFKRCIETLRLIVSLHYKGSRKRKAGNMSQSSQTSQKSKSQIGAKKKIGLTQEHFKSDDTPEVELSEFDVVKLQQCLLELLQSLVGLLKSSSLRNQTESNIETIQIMADLSSVEPDTFTNDFDVNIREKDTNSISHLSYIALCLLCTRLDGISAALFRASWKALLSNLLMLVGEKKDHPAQVIPREAVMVKDQTIAFIIHMMSLGGENLDESVHRLIARMVQSAPDRTEYRAKIAQNVLSLLDRMKDPGYARAVRWCLSLTRSDKPSLRMMGLEICGSLLQSTKLRQLSGDSDDMIFCSRSTILQTILIRCSDKNTSVTAKAISILGQCLSCADNSILSQVKDFITPRTVNRTTRKVYNRLPERTGEGTDMGSLLTTTGSGDVSSIHTATRTRVTSESNSRASVDSASDSRQSAFSQKTFSRYTTSSSGQTLYLTQGFDITLADADGVVSMLKRRLNCQKVGVRKASLMTLESMIRFNDCQRVSEELEILRARCRDVALVVRKQCVISLSELLLAYPEVKDVQSAWLNGVLQAVNDCESSVQEKSWDYVESIILQKIVKYAESKEQKHKLAWDLLGGLSGSGTSVLCTFLQESCFQLSKRGRLQKSLIQFLTTHISTENNNEAWLLLSLVSPIVSEAQLDGELIANYWLSSTKSSSDEDTSRYILTSLAFLASSLSNEKKQQVADDLLQRLIGFGECVDKISLIVTALVQLTNNSNCAWSKQLLADIETYLDQLIMSDSYVLLDHLNLVRRLAVYGEVALHDPKAVTHRAISLIQSLVSPPTDGNLRKAFLMDLDEGKLGLDISNQAIICLGKLCLQHEQTAKQSIPVLAAEMSSSAHSRTRSNILLILCDMCKLYTNAVGPYITSMAAVLKDSDPMARKHAFVGMSRLLQEDYLKWKGVLFFRFIAAVTDDCPEIANLARQTFSHVLVKRCPAMFHQHFIECVFHFNEYQNHKVYNCFKQTVTEKQKFTMKGDEHAHRRHAMYAFMLSHMTDGQKFNVTQKLCQDVISALVEKSIKLDEQGEAILIDSLAILSSKEIKLSVMRRNENDDADAPAAAKAASAAVSKVVRKNLMETVIPDIIDLKQMLQASYSPCLKNLMLFLIEIMKDYKAEISDVLAGNRQLAAEIEFDMKKFEEQRQLKEALNYEQVVGTSGQLQKTPGQHTPGQVLKTPLNICTPAGRTPGSKTPGPLSSSALPVSTTPAMPPPPLRSALKKQRNPVFSTNAKIMDEVTKSKDKIRTPKRVNFDERESDDDALLSIPVSRSRSKRLQELSKSDVPTPLPPRFTANLGTRAISTPDATLANITFGPADTTQMSPIIMLNNKLSGNDGSSSSVHSNKTVEQENVDPLLKRTAWNVQSPASLRSRKSRPAPVDVLEVEPIPLVPTRCRGKRK